MSFIQDEGAAEAKTPTMLCVDIDVQKLVKESKWNTVSANGTSSSRMIPSIAIQLCPFPGIPIHGVIHGRGLLGPHPNFTKLSFIVDEEVDKFVQRLKSTLEKHFQCTLKTGITDKRALSIYCNERRVHIYQGDKEITLKDLRIDDTVIPIIVPGVWLDNQSKGILYFSLDSLIVTPRVNFIR